MYLSYFALTEAPFSIAPDPRYLYMSQRHQEALAHLLYGVNGEGGFVLLTGEVGTGKTTICRCLLEQIPDACVVAYIFNPRLTVAELLSTICVEFGIDFPPGNTSLKLFVDLITRFLLDAHAQGKRAVLIIDEAQNLSTDVLEQMRLLTNLETSQRKLLQIILLGQPELLDMLGRPELRQLAQRIVARYHLDALTREEVATYVQHRLEVSGVYRQLFATSLMNRIHRLTGGVPRIINVLCDRALLGTYVQGKDRVDRSTLMRAARETLQPSTPAYRRRAVQLSAGLLLLASAAWGAQWYQQQNLPGPESAPLQAKNALEKPLSASVRAVSPRNEERGIVTRPVADTLEWTASAPRANSRDMAFGALFRAWNMDFPGTDACRRVESVGLYCRSSRGGLEELRQLNRPAVLQLQDEAGREFYATLMRLDADRATFALGDQTREVRLGALAAHWSGYYTVLWRTPPAGYKNIRPGERGPAVEWLNRLLAQAQGRAEGASAHRVFDASLTRQVKQFQLAHGLMPDGMAGPQTLTHLIAAADQQAPRLLAQLGEK
ncbi:MAG: AAA family ATPase [Sulfuricella sp.]